jgi:hypothetical protein
MSRLLFLLPLLICLPCNAATVYKSVDARGRVTFSDTPPEQAVSVQILEVQAQTAHDPELYLQRMAVMTEVTDKIAAARLQREKLRLSAKSSGRELGAGDFAVQGGAYYDNYNNNYASSGYYNGVRRHHRKRPVHPIVYPPKPQLRGAAQVNQYPASLVRRSYSPRVAAVFQNSPPLSPSLRQWPH